MEGMSGDPREEVVLSQNVDLSNGREQLPKIVGHVSGYRRIPREEG